MAPTVSPMPVQPGTHLEAFDDEDRHERARTPKIDQPLAKLLTTAAR